jgi:hypothetical protein
MKRRVQERRAVVEHIDIAALKARQDAREARAQALLNRFVLFRDSFIGTVNQFAAEAIAAGLHGAAPCTVTRSDAQIVEAQTTIAGAQLLLAAPGRAYAVRPIGGAFPPGADEDSLCAKILAFSGKGSEDSPAVYEAVIYDTELSPAPVMHYLRWRRTTGWDWVFGAHVLGDDSGGFAATQLISHLYLFHSPLKDDVTLRMLRHGTGQLTPLGFHTGERCDS